MVSRWAHFHGLNNRTAEESEGYESALRQAIEDARITHREHLRSLEEEAHKAGRVSRVDAIILTIIASAFSIRSLPLDQVLSLYFVFGVVSISFGMIVALYAQYSIEVDAGLSRGAFDELRERKLSEKGYLEWSLRGYSNMIEEAEDVVNNRGELIQTSIIFSVGGVFLVLLGTIM